MKNYILFISILLIAVLGGAGLFYIESKLPDNELVNRDVNAQLLKIDGLNSSINELALRSRANLDSNYDMLVRNTVALERSVTELSDSYFNQQQISGSLLETRFDRFRDSIEIKMDQVENFKSNNSVLRNSEKYTPLVGAELAYIASQNELPELSSTYKQIVLDVLEFTKQGSDKPEQDVVEYGSVVRQSGPVMPAENSIKILEFANHVTTAIDSKNKTDRYLNLVLNASTNDQIEDISTAWALWQTENNNTQETLRYYTLAYVLAVLVLFGVLVYRLRSLYKNLDREVEAKTKEVQETYQELHDSERQLVQSEKMASLGQLVAGVAHEINTPLSYISSNMTTINARFSRFEPVLQKAEAISKILSDPDGDRSAINGLLKDQIVALRGVGKNNTPEKINTLINDSSEGLQEIKEIVDSLTNFSHVQEVPAENIDVNERLKSSLKMTSKQIGERKIISDFNADLPAVSGAPNQLAQVFSNIITNAVHATDAQNGAISIKTNLVGDRVNIVFRDNGRGIDDESLKRVFEPFFTTKEVGEGTGLGLSIAHRIIEAHQGELRVESQVGVGTTVTVILPAVNAATVSSVETA